MRIHTIVLALLGSLASLAPAQPATDRWADPPADLARRLTRGVESIDAPGAPGPVMAFGPGVVPIVTPENDASVVVAGEWLGGRVLAFGHGGFLGSKDPGTLDLLTNAIDWMNDPPVRPALRIWGASSQLHDHATEHARGFQPIGGDWREGIAHAHILILDTHQIRTEEDRLLVRAFLKRGGSLITSGLAWGWLQLNPEETIDQHPGNLLLADAGIAWTDGTVPEDAGDRYEIDPEPSRMAHAGCALAGLIEGSLNERDRATAASAISRIVRTLPQSDLARDLAQEIERRGGAFDEAYRRMSTRGLSWREHALERLGVEVWMLRHFDAEPNEVIAHPSAAGFPGGVPIDVDRREVRLTIDTTIPGWRATGLYAVPGERALVELVGRHEGLSIQIGSHLDPESRGDLNRLPRVVRTFPLDGPKTVVANPVGGLIYLVVPKGFEEKEVRLKIQGAVRAPHFVLGVTDEQQWRDEIRSYPGPWAELETREIALTVPSEVIRDLENPVELMELWDQIVRTQGSLEPRRLNGLGDRQARFVPDVSVSWGYMYAPADRPLTVPMKASTAMVSSHRLRTNEGGDIWGLYHELGHWHQNAMWTFGGTGEVTVNLFTLYTFEKVCGLPPAEARGFTPEKMLSDMRKHAELGAPFEKWKSDPFLALTMYVQMKEAFGWELYERVFAEYRSLPTAERPASDADKRDQWLVRMSRGAGRNLGPFFEAWGVPTSDEARAAVAHLPAWMPEGWSPAGGQ